MDLDLDLSLSRPLFVQKHELGFAQIQSIAHLLHEFASALIRRAQCQTFAIVTVTHDIRIQNVIHVNAVRDDIVKLPIEHFGEHRLH